MPCNDYLMKIGPYVDGELPGAEREEIDDHMEACGECRRVAREFSVLDRLSAAAAPPAVSGREWERTLAAVERRATSRGGARVVTWWFGVATSVAAMLLLAFVLSGDILAPRTEETGGATATTTDPAPEEVSGTPRFAQGSSASPEEVEGGDRDDDEATTDSGRAADAQGGSSRF